MGASLSRIKLTQGKWATVDSCYYKQLMILGPWYFGHGGYAVKSLHNPAGVLRMHREILRLANVRLQRCTDHQNRNKLDNRVVNLRPCTYAQNNAYRHGKVGKYKGVTWNKRDGKFQARLRQKSLGYFDTAKKASLAYQKAAKQEYGNFAHV